MTWTILKTIMFGLLDLFVLMIIIKCLFKTPTQFVKSLSLAGKGSFLSTVTKDNRNDPLSGYKIFCSYRPNRS